MQTAVEFSLPVFTLVTGFLGVWFLIRGLIGRRAASDRCCPRCRYDMRKTEGLRCPECGASAKSEASLRPRRRSWRCVVASVFFIAITIGCGLLLRAARDKGWPATVPATAWILGVRLTDSDLPMRELGFDIRVVDGFVVIPTDPTTELWPWQRSLLRNSLYRRLTGPRDDVRAEAMASVAFLLPSREEMTQRERALLERLCGDPDARVANAALMSLAERLDAPESDPLIRSILDDPARDERSRTFALTGIFARYGAFGGAPDPRLVELLLEHLDDAGGPGAVATRAARRIAEAGLSDPRLVTPLLAKAEATIGRQGAITVTALVAAWRHADAAQQADVRDAILAALPGIEEDNLIGLPEDLLRELKRE